MTQMQPTEQPLDDDPLFGKYIAHYPVQRTQLLIQAGIIYALVTLVLQVAFANLDDVTAAIFLITAFSVMAFGLGWYVLHLWNREVVLYDRGFHYREGSKTVPIQYSEIIAMRQRAERVALFGVLPRDVHQYTLLTKNEELIVLNNRYHRIGELGQRLDKAIVLARRPILEHLLATGETLVFHEKLTMTQDGLHSGGEHLPWDAIHGYRAEGGQFIIRADSAAPWFTGRLEEIDNLTLLFLLLKARVKKHTAEENQH